MRGALCWASVRIQQIKIRNFRCFRALLLDLAAGPASFVAPNGGGKSTLLEAVARACGAVAPRLTSQDFRDSTQPIEIVAVVSNLPTDTAALYADELRFETGGPVMSVGVRASWDDEQEELEIVHGFPDHGWRRSTKEQRDALPTVWLPTSRDVAQQLRIVGRQNVLASLVEALDMDQALEEAATSLEGAAQDLAATQVLVNMLQAAAERTSTIVPGTVTGFDLSPVSRTKDDLLRLLELSVEGDTGLGLPVDRISSGAGQISLFAFVLRLLASSQDEYVLIVDEPELSLHPQAQRSLMSELASESAQLLVATHSPSILDRADSRTVRRLSTGADGVEVKGSGAISDAAARRLQRIANPRTAEAFFATKVILVEGESDYLALSVLAERSGVDLDGAGVSLISLEGAGSFSTFVTLLGPAGLEIPLIGMCDADHESTWRGALSTAGMNVPDATSMAAEGFFVCRQDLEDEVFRALGATQAEAALRAAGLGAALDLFASQPTQTGPREQVLRRFIDKNKVEAARALADALDVSIQTPLHEVLARV